MTMHVWLCNSNVQTSFVTANLTEDVHCNHNTGSLVAKGFPDDSDGEESACNAGNLGLFPGSERAPGEENGYPLQDSCLENSMDRGAWQTMVHGITQSWTEPSDEHFHLLGAELQNVNREYGFLGGKKKKIRFLGSLAARWQLKVPAK